MVAINLGAVMFTLLLISGAFVLVLALLQEMRVGVAEVVEQFMVVVIFMMTDEVVTWQR